MLSVPVLVAIGSILVSSSAVVVYRKLRIKRSVRQEKKCVIKEGRMIHITATTEKIQDLSKRVKALWGYL